MNKYDRNQMKAETEQIIKELEAIEATIEDITGYIADENYLDELEYVITKSGTLVISNKSQ